ncbi:MAG: glycosyltransferase [Acidimicrobiia bacterium]
MSDSRSRALVAYVHYPETLSYTRDWLDAFRSAPSLDVVVANLATPLGRRRLRRSVESADLVVLLHTVLGNSLGPVRRCLGPLLSRRAPLLAFVANEVSLPGQPLAEKVELLHELEAQFVATQLLVETSQHLYAATGAKVLAAPHALNPKAYQSEMASKQRPIDVGFRGARYLPHVGDEERNRIIDYFAMQSFDPPLVTDVRTNVSYDRRGWARFLNRCKGIVGAEAGAVDVRPDDAILRQAEEQLGVRSGDLELRARLRPVHRYLPRGAKNFVRRIAERASGRGQPPAPSAPSPVLIGTGHSGKCVSSRHFDAIGTETCQILFPGRYNDLLVADRHYLRLETDFSNIDDVLARFRDDAHRTRLAHETREWALQSHTHAHRIRALLDDVGVH